MRKGQIAVVCVLYLGLSGMARGQVLSELSLPPSGDNQRAEVSQWIGPVKVSIEYHSPNVHGTNGKDRTGHIWGELVPYGFWDDGFGPSKAIPWRIGANESTTLTLSHDVKIGGKELKAGTYGLFLKIEKEGAWTWIFSNNIGWGSYQYDPKNDALRLDAQPQAAPYTEFMTFGFDERRPDSSVAYLQWENKRIAFKIDVPNVNDLYVAAMRKELQGWPGFNYRNWQVAAQFCADHKINLEEALVWADKAIYEPFRNAAQGREDFSTLQTKSAVLRAMGRDAEADAVGDKAIHMPGTPALAILSYGVRLINAGKAAQALEVMKFNQQQHPGEKFMVYLGLARAYTALGDKANAIASWESVLQNVPPERRGNIPAYQDTLKKLKEGK